MTGNIDGKGRLRPKPCDDRFGEQSSVRVELEQETTPIRVLIDLPEARVLKHFPSRQIQPENTYLGHVVDESYDLAPRQFLGDPVLLVIGICVAVSAMKIASVSELELCVRDAMGARCGGMHSPAEFTVSQRGKRTSIRHASHWGERDLRLPDLSIGSQMTGGSRRNLPERSLSEDRSRVLDSRNTVGGCRRRRCEIVSFH